jgi:hypothetical protein
MLSNDLTRSLFDGDDDERADEAAAAGGPAAAAPAADSPADTLALLRQWVAAGWLRRLDGALAALLAELDPEARPRCCSARRPWPIWRDTATPAWTCAS